MFSTINFRRINSFFKFTKLYQHSSVFINFLISGSDGRKIIRQRRVARIKIEAIAFTTLFKSYQILLIRHVLSHKSTSSQMLFSQF